MSCICTAKAHVNAGPTVIGKMIAGTSIPVIDKWSHKVVTVVILGVVHGRDIIVHQTIIAMESDLSNNGWVRAVSA